MCRAVPEMHVLGTLMFQKPELWKQIGYYTRVGAKGWRGPVFSKTAVQSHTSVCSEAHFAAMPTTRPSGSQLPTTGLLGSLDIPIRDMGVFRQSGGRMGSRTRSSGDESPLDSTAKHTTPSNGQSTSTEGLDQRSHAVGTNRRHASEHGRGGDHLTQHGLPGRALQAMAERGTPVPDSLPAAHFARGLGAHRDHWNLHLEGLDQAVRYHGVMRD
jgi:hypothetical protein